MTAWEHPFVILLALAVAVGVGFWLIRAAEPRGPIAFHCTVCGRKRNEAGAREWRYCPYCGAGKNARGTFEMPRRVQRPENPSSKAQPVPMDRVPMSKDASKIDGTGEDS